MQTILTNCTVIDCTGASPRPNHTVIVEGSRIAAIRPGRHAAVGEGSQPARVIDLNGGYLLPGLWCVHAHLGLVLPDRKNIGAQETPADYTIRAGRNAMDALRRGITAIRTAGDRDYVDIAWRRAFDAGLAVGPRIFACGKYICATGGHGHELPLAVEVDGPYDMRRVVREQLKHGADHIKLAVTGGIMTAGESMQESQLQPDEVEAAVEVAHQKGKRVMVHAGGVGGVRTSLQAGVDSIEHGYYLDDETVDLMAEKGAFLVPTLFVTQYQKFMLASGMPAYQLEKARAGARAHLASFQKALRAGVKIACGMDSSPIGEHTLIEIEELVRAGMQPMLALIAATRTSADLCQAVDRLGTVESGKLADLIAVAADPLADISNLRRLTLVMKNGALVDTADPEGQADFWKMFWE